MVVPMRHTHSCAALSFPIAGGVYTVTTVGGSFSWTEMAADGRVGRVARVKMFKILPVRQPTGPCLTVLLSD